ncbi:MAG: anthranilate synthase component I [Actinomycetota bacterium]|nr:anthranilate synthase component I [Actinomycetota bacterium]
MFSPSKSEYLKKSKNYNLIPVYKEYIVDTETPASLFMKTVGAGRKGFLLESIEGIKNLSRYSFIGIGFSKLIEFDKGVFSLIGNGERIYNVKTSNPLGELEKTLKDYNLYRNPELKHFVGGAAGYLSYDLVRYFEGIPLPEKNLSVPEIMLYLTDLVIVFDHLLNRIKIISTIKIGDGFSAEESYDRSVESIERIEEKIKKNSGNNFKNGFSTEGIGKDAGDLKPGSNFDRDKFLEGVEKAKRYITRGDAFQIVLSQKFYTSKFSDSFSIYRGLRAVNPSPYMYYFDFGKFKIVGASPEPLIKIKGSRVATYPIAGTRKRGKSAREDKALIKSLLNDQKERAEHNMLVDLSRNDLGRICRYGSVKVKKYMSVEKYSHVIHLVSRVEGVLDKGKTIYDALKSVFPAGTLSGAPKIRAMQIISELEPERRGPYGGTVGYFGYDGNLDSCITIRTAVIKDGMAYIQAGAGIVYDSKPENEYSETINKAAAIFKAIGLFK